MNAVPVGTIRVLRIVPQPPLTRDRSQQVEQGSSQPSSRGRAGKSIGDLVKSYSDAFPDAE